jgi:hypothetical protein
LSFWMRSDLADGPSEQDLRDEIRDWVTQDWRGTAIQISDYEPTEGQV